MLKTLIRCTPSRFVSFVSEAWGGYTSANEITDKLRLVEMLDPGDVVMADIGVLTFKNLQCPKEFLLMFLLTLKKLGAVDVEKITRIAE